MDEPIIIEPRVLDPEEDEITFGFCERCGRDCYVVACIGPDGELLAYICDDCAREWIDSGLDEL